MSIPEEAPHSAGPAAAAGFEALGLDPRLLDALTKLGFDEPTPIQADAMPPLLAGRDVIGRARTGSGKTAAFGLPLLEKVKEGGAPVRALVLAPTRELALQVTDALRSFAAGLPVRVVTLYGGASYGPQLKALSRGVPVVVGTPGRVLDHLERGTLDLSALELLVLDEADEMLRMGFFEDVEKVLAAAPPGRQVALFSATMPEPIQRVAEQLGDPLEIQVEDSALSVDHIEQRMLLVPHRHKLDALSRLLASEPIESALVFARTRAGCAEIADELARRGLQVDALHGDMNQPARERVLLRFRSGALKVVIATDVASRGIDVERISHVINLDLPNAAEAYVHRIGRTGRAGRKGVAISLVTPGEVPRLRFFQRALDVTIERGKVPSDAAIAAVERARLMGAVAERAAGDPSPGVAAMLAELGEEHDLHAVACAALELLVAEHGIELEAKLDAQPPEWARRADRGRDKKGGRDDGGRGARSGERDPRADEVELFLPVGKRRGVRPGDLVGVLANEVGVDAASIGRVTILDHKSFVRLSSDAAEQVLSKHKKLQVRGRDVPVAKARPRGAAPGGAPKPKRPKKGGNKPPRRWKHKK